MRRCFTVVCLAVAVGVTGFALGQGSAGGYGQGGGLPGGGGFGGAMGGRSGLAERNLDRIDNEQVDGLWETRTAVLTPGDRVEFKLKVEAGTTLLASATSDAFDPALAVEDSKGKTLIKNDDREEGDQSPLVVYRFADAGTYTLKVLSYRSVSGGKFMLRMRRFRAEDAPLAKQHHSAVQVVETNGSRRIEFRLTGKKGGIYDLRGVRNADGGNYGAQLIRVIGPTGVALNDYRMLETRDSVPVFEALADGDYYAEYTTYGGVQFDTDFRLVQMVAMKADADQSIDLDVGELKIVEFPVEPNLIVRTTLSGGSAMANFAAPPPENTDTAARGDRYDPGTGSFAAYPLNRDSENDVVRVYRAKGNARLMLRSTQVTPVKVAVKNATSLPTWESGSAMSVPIGIGDAKLLLIRSSKSELMRVHVAADHFQPRLEIYRLNGDLANTLCDRVTHTAGDDLYFPDQGTFIARLTCDGDGGSGSFSLKRETLTPAPYALGAADTVTLNGENFGLYSVNLEAGKRYELMNDHPDHFLRADLLDDDGQFLVSRAIVFDTVQVRYFTPTKSGVHRLWLRGGSGSWRFKLSLHIAPTIG